MRTKKWKFQNMTLAWCVRKSVSCHHTVHFCRPAEEISSFFFQIWPSWSLKKRKACGFWLLVKQTLSDRLSIRSSALPNAHSAHPWSWWCLVEHQWCRMQEAPPVFSTLYAPTHHGSDRVMVEQLQHSAGLQRCFEHPCTPASCRSSSTWTRFSTCSAIRNFKFFQEISEIPGRQTENPRVTILTPKDFDGLEMFCHPVLR